MKAELVSTLLCAGAAAASSVVWLWLLRRVTNQIEDFHQRQISELVRRLQHEERKRHDERAGRTKAEKMLRKQHLQRHPSGVQSLKPIAYLRSVFPERCGTPRQGLLAPHSRAKLEFCSEIQPRLSLEGLEKFSHLWLVGVFHHNTDVIKDSFKTKVRPPRLAGHKVGVFATRSPHRPNPLALSLAKIDRIDNGVIYLSGIDMVDSTPIVDIKPYVPRYDSLPHAKCAPWIDSDEGVFGAVHFSLESDAALESDIIANSSFYNDSRELKCLVREVLRRDIRSLNQKNVSAELLRQQIEPKIYQVQVDCLRVFYSVNEHSVVQVHDIRLSSPCDEDVEDELGSREEA